MRRGTFSPHPEPAPSARMCVQHDGPLALRREAGKIVRVGCAVTFRVTWSLSPKTAIQQMMRGAQNRATATTSAGKHLLTVSVWSAGLVGTTR
jgi:hypothetical protein